MLTGFLHKGTVGDTGTVGGANSTQVWEGRPPLSEPQDLDAEGTWPKLVTHQPMAAMSWVLVS